MIDLRMLRHPLTALVLASALACASSPSVPPPPAAAVAAVPGARLVELPNADHITVLFAPETLRAMRAVMRGSS
jgi:hypothetical protein